MITLIMWLMITIQPPIEYIEMEPMYINSESVSEFIQMEPLYISTKQGLLD